MANGIIFSPDPKGIPDPSVYQKAMAFLQKLQADDTLLGLHIEPIKNSADPKVRTGRVDKFYRAVLFKLNPSVGPTQYVYIGTWPHDDAIAVAKKATLSTNPVNGIGELVVVHPTPAQEAAPAAVTEAVPEALVPLMEQVSPTSTVERLVTELGLDPRLAAALWETTDEDAVLALAENAVGWQGMAILELASGGTIESVTRTFALDTLDVDPAASEDDRLAVALRHESAKSHFAWLEHDDELKAVVESEDFAAWRIFLHPEQRRYVTKDYNGPFRLTGGAGTGKTVVLLHRARRLAQANPQARIVLTTYTRTLAAALRRDLLLLDPHLPIAAKLGDPGIHVAGVDQLANAVLAHATPDDRDAAVAAVFGTAGNPANKRLTATQQAWKDALAGVGATLPPAAATHAFMSAEYDEVVLPERVASQEQYLKVRRPGRGVALGRTQRAQVWKVVQAYRNAAAAQGAVDHSEVFALSTQLLSALDENERPADHVLVDEGQDLISVRWQFLRALVAEGVNDLFIAEDAAQRIYGRRVTLGRCGIKIVGRSRRLSLNYRTTHQLLTFATSVLDGDQWESEIETTEESDGQGSKYRSARSGPVPVRKGLDNLVQQLDTAADTIRHWVADNIETHTIGVLVRDATLADLVVRGLGEREVKSRHITQQATTTKDVQVMTMHRAKGMEFSRVIVFGASAKNLPAQYALKNLDEVEHADVMQRERSLFYVAATRARDELAVLWDGKPSEFLA